MLQQWLQRFDRLFSLTKNYLLLKERYIIIDGGMWDDRFILFVNDHLDALTFVSMYTQRLEPSTFCFKQQMNY